MTHEPGHTTDPNYDKLHWKIKMGYDEVMQEGDPTKKKKKSKFKKDKATEANAY